ncbi:MurR/RpiR family transcriptional regulator [Bacillus sp. 4A_MP2]
MEDLIYKLQHKVVELTDAQRRIADYIVQNPMEVAFLTVDKLASKVGTSTATIMRFSAAVGIPVFLNSKRASISYEA